MRLEDADIQDGDALLFMGRAWYSRFIEAWTQSRYSHAALCVWLHAAGIRRLYVLEALAGPGIKLRPLDTYLHECQRDGVQVDWYRLVDWRVSRTKVVATGLHLLDQPYASVGQFARSFGLIGSRLRKLLGWPALVDERGMFCSEVVASVYRAAGFAADIEPALTDPGSVAMFPCLHREGRLEP